ncbi:endolytic transglycosylase MltG [Breznakiella homolactica]|uniref:Endolytic murein transglycosylase n=1 Tax=Breznakiella homolactica TaxID=2798577 RepID=A0A7T7XKX2_9SPIR|nr:endolytic transglycosylase MltG [Breznakiella homolactica]QQO08153.1 endolytic transglycosylase MltG [Breznakiella homolactica]
MPKFIRTISKFLAILIGAILAVSAACLGLALFFNTPPEDPPSIPQGVETIKKTEDGSYIVEIRSGDTAMAVGKRLADANIIRSRLFWNVLSRINPEHIKAGVYSLDLPMTQFEIRSLLVSGRQILVRVTIPEGSTLKKNAAILEAAGICGAEEFLAAAADPEITAKYRVPGETMEGYLYPDTYLFPQGFPAARVVQTMADTFFSRLRQAFPEADSLTPDELNQRVIIASIVEREYRIPDEAPLMAGVFYNRLRIGMPLQSCATVEYIITEIQGRPHPERLFTRDTEIRDPYNTYIRPGLPPGPISAPGMVALRASFEPAASTYLYFRVADPSTGRHYFSETLDDHIRAGVLYLKGSF